jgi:hypothetical protein
MTIEPFHTGILVASIEPAIAAWSGATGIPWGALVEAPLPTRYRSGDVVEHQIRLAYSSDMHLELVERIPGSIWDLDGRDGVHHTGAWTWDLIGDAAAIEAKGWPVVASGVGEGGEMVSFSYHEIPGQGLFEIVDIAQRELMLQLFGLA